MKRRMSFPRPIFWIAALTLLWAVLMAFNLGVLVGALLWRNFS